MPEMKGSSEDDLRFMTLALEAARAAALRDEVPVGAVVVGEKGEILAVSGNRTEELFDPSAHAEVLALRAACAQRSSPRIPEATLYVTLEPCALCAAAISFARVRRVVFGAFDPKGGAVEHGPKFFTLPTCHHRPDVTGGLEAEASASLLRAFFAAKRTKKDRA